MRNAGQLSHPLAHLWQRRDISREPEATELLNEAQ